MKLVELVEALVAAKATPEAILAAVRVAEASREVSAEKARARVQRWRDRKRSETLPHVSQRLTGEGARVEDKPLTQKIEPQEENKKRAQDALRAEFDTAFWPEYPNKVGKPKAFTAFCAARKRAELSTILDGLRRYIANKPPDRAWLNPATFLNQERFNDQPAVVVPMARAGPRPNPLMDRLDAILTRPPNDDDPATSQALVLHASAGFGGR